MHNPKSDMSMMRKLLLGLLVIVVFAMVGFAIVWFSTEPEKLPNGTESASRLAAGPYSVGRSDFEWIDTERIHAYQNGESEPSGQRVLPTTIWYPEDLDEEHPLLVFSHGLMSSRRGCTYMAEHLASHGYVIVSADHPFTNADAPGGPDLFDVVNQPADISFLIDQMLDLRDGEQPFKGTIDAKRIGAFGISLGANTVTLAAFHPEWRDPRIAAVISIVGHGDVFGPLFFDHASIPFLMIAGTADAIVDYDVNAKPIPGRIRQGGLVTIEGATHAGFTDMTAGLLRVLGNPDNLGCGAVSADDIPQDQSPFVGLFGTPEQGLIVPSEYRAPCAKTFEHVMKAGRQQSIATIVVHAFFESQFAGLATEQIANREFLEETLPSELEEVSYMPGLRARSLSSHDDSTP